jgi:uncharacterized repeat protein (TIGR01451 family)
MFFIFAGDRPAQGAVGVVERVSLTNGGGQGDNFHVAPAISADGRFVAFESDSISLVPGDTNAARDIFVRDICRGAPSDCTPSTVRISRSSAGAQANSYSLAPAISADGRFVAFESEATNLVTGDTNDRRDVFLRDTCSGAPPACMPSTTRVSVASGDTQANEGSGQGSISADGRYVAFQSGATNFPADTNNVTDVYVRDTCHGGPPGCVPSTLRASVANSGAQGSFASFAPAISGDGRFVSFISFASNLVPGDTNGISGLFIRDTCLGAAPGCTPSTIRVSVSSGGAQADRDSFEPALGADGRFVAFRSWATNLVPGDANLADDVFLRDTCLGAPPGCVPSTTFVSLSSGGAQSLRNCKNPALSATGRLVVFSSDASNLVPGDSNVVEDVFVRDTCVSRAAGCTPSTVRVSVAADGSQGNLYSSFFSPPAISADGRFAAFDSEADNLVPNDTNGFPDVFFAETGFQVEADLSITQTSSPDPAIAGSSLTYTLTIHNQGADFATAVAVLDQLPAGLAFVSATPSRGSCSEAGGIVRCKLGTLAEGTDATVAVGVIPTAPGMVSNTTTVAATEADPDTTNNTATSNMTVVPASTPAGVVPDGGDAPGVPLTLEMTPGGDVFLTWGPSCTLTDTDYEIYEGDIDAGFTSHQPRLCSTGGVTSATLAPAAGNSYFLVVPRNSTREGSYGRRSDGSERPQSASACLVQELGSCP